MVLAQRNLLSIVVMLKRGTAVAHISAVNKVQPKLAPRVVMQTSPVNALLSAYPGVNVEIEKRTSAFRHATSMHSTYSGKVRQALWKARSSRGTGMVR